MPITITVPEVAVKQPTAPPPSANISVTAPEGKSVVSVDLPTITNNGNIAKKLRVTITNIVNTKVNTLGISNNGNYTSQDNVVTFESTVNPSMVANGKVIFGVTPGQPGQPASQASADYLYEWV